RSNRERDAAACHVGGANRGRPAVAEGDDDVVARADHRVPIGAFVQRPIPSEPWVIEISRDAPHSGDSKELMGRAGSGTIWHRIVEAIGGDADIRPKDIDTDEPLRRMEAIVCERVSDFTAE